MLRDESNMKCPMEKIDGVSQNILSYIRKKLLKKYGEKKPLRGFHAKSIGLVNANFKVEENLDDYLKTGLFQKAKTYDAWIRFSNGRGTASPDTGKDIRGMAIKILLAQNSEFPLDNNIILFTSRVTIPGPVEKQPAIARFVMGSVLERIWAGIKAAPSLTIRAVLAFVKGTIKTPNILEELYYSATPYSFGEKKAIKWHARSLKTITSIMSENPSDDFLRERLISDLSENAKHIVSFALYVQFQENEQTEPIEDPSIDWKTKFYKVATITIPKQNLDTPERKEKDKNMSFSPGHAIAEHAPLGCVNMIRKKVYEQLTKERLEHP